MVGRSFFGRADGRSGTKRDSESSLYNSAGGSGELLDQFGGYRRRDARRQIQLPSPPGTDDLRKIDGTRRGGEQLRVLQGIGNPGATRSEGHRKRSQG